MKRKIAILLIIALILSFIPAIIVNAAETTVVYQKISTMDELTTGQYVMVLDGTGYAPTKYNNKWVEVGKPTLSGNEITEANATSYIWNLTVSGTSVTLTDSAGKTIKPNSTSSASITTDSAGTYTWTASCTNGTFRFTGTGSYTGFILAANKSSSYKIRAYKSGSASANTGSFPSYFTLYKRVEITNDDPTGTEAPTTAPTIAPTEAPTTAPTQAPDVPVADEATIVFDDAGKREIASTIQHIWRENNITVTQDKGNGNALVENVAPIRVYKNAKLTIAYPKAMTKMEITCNTTGYASDLQQTISGSTVDGKVVTVIFAEPVASFEITMTVAQVRVDSIKVYTTAVEVPTEPTVAPTEPTAAPTEPAMTEPATEAPTQAPDVPVADEATIVFDSTDKRTEYSTTKQVWGENNITVTNDKASSSSNVGDYVSPARFYKSSKLTIAYPKAMTKIEITCNTTDYASDLQQTISGSTVNGKVVTVVLAEAANTFEVSLTVGKVFVDSIKVYAGVEEEEPDTILVGASYNVHLIEPWALRVKVQFAKNTQDNLIPVSNFTDYGAYAIIGNKFEGATAEELMADEDAVKYTKAADNITAEGTTLTFDFYDGLYSYNLGESVYWVAYFVTADGTHYTTVQEKSLTKVADSLLGKEDVSDTEKAVLQSMKDLKDAVITLRGENADLGNIYPAGTANNSALGEKKDGIKFGTTHQIKLIEPWGVRVRVLMRDVEASAYADYENADDYGVIFFHDKTGKYNGTMTAAQMNAETGAKVYSKLEGSAEIAAHGVVAVYDEGIYTYDLDTELYCLPYIVIDGNYYYPANATCWNLLDEMVEFSEDTDLDPKETAVFDEILKMYENVQKHKG